MTILVVEDEPTLRETLAEALESDGFRVLQAADGLAALEVVRAERPDLVLLDLLLPGLPGFEVTKRIRAASDVPIVMLTARDAEVDKVVGLELGADDYVTKPFSIRELSARIRAVLRRLGARDPADARAAGMGQPSPGGSAETGGMVHLGTVQVDLAGHRILRRGEALAVKPKVFDLLAYLLRHRGQVVTRDQLLEHVWGYDFSGESRTVDVHVHWLRQAVEDDPADPKLIETVRGTGYVLRAPAASIAGAAETHRA